MTVRCSCNAVPQDYSFKYKHIQADWLSENQPAKTFEMFTLHPMQQISPVFKW